MLRFALFLLLHLVLFIRPSDLFEELEAANLYELAILAAALASSGSLLRLLDPRTITTRPMVLFVLGLLAAVVVSLLANGLAGAAVSAGVKYAKVVLYFLLVVANLDTPGKFRLFLIVVGGLMAFQATLGMAQYFGAINLPAFQAFDQKEYDADTGAMSVLQRMCGCGIFHDPNDLCVLLAVCSLLCLYVIFDPRFGWARFLVVIPLAGFVAAIPLTHSRGGLLALLAGLGSLAVTALGVRRGAIALVLVVPVILLGVGGRMTRIQVDSTEDTSQHRIHLWSDGLTTVPSHPLFGSGQGTYVEIAGLVAHNSYVEAYTELGLLGGSLFSALFAYALWVYHRLGRAEEFKAAGSLTRFRPFGAAVLVAFAVGMYSLSRLYTQPMYTVFGITAAYFALVSERVPGLIPPLSWKMTAALAAVGVGLLMALYLFVRVMVRWS